MGWISRLVQLRLCWSLDAKPGDVEAGKEQQRQDRTHDDTAHHRIGHRTPEDLMRDGNEREAGGRCRQQDGTHAMFSGFNDGVPGLHSLVSQRLNLNNEDHRVANQNANEREDAENCDEAKRCTRWQQCSDHSNHSQRCDRDNENESLETLQLDHQDGRDAEQHERYDFKNRPLPLGTLFNGTARLKGISRRQLLIEVIYRTFELRDDCRWLNGFVDARFDGDRG